jgi:hypothetical protein
VDHKSTLKIKHDPQATAGGAGAAPGAGNGSRLGIPDVSRREKIQIKSQHITEDLHAIQPESGDTEN